MVPPACRVALRVAYFGPAFVGSQRQPRSRGRTVEGELLRALRANHALAGGSAARARFLTAARTDAGVSALANVFALDTRFPRLDKLAVALTSRLTGAWVTAGAEVPASFHPRAARSRRYVYSLPARDLDDRALGAALALFLGEHDFASFCKREPHRSTIRTLDRYELEEDEGARVFRITFEAEAFLWNQVRRMVEAARRVASGEATRDEVVEALAGKRRVDLGIAPAEDLLLAAVEYADVAWVESGDAKRLAAREIGERLADVDARRRALAAISDAVRR
ncbi:MAG: tRNA pseudouridine synthase A [Thermoplasmatota archaeon]